ncbi:MAG TPA: TraB/GumN family protein [Croceibacterium sp.]|nr:TraB/GumN family protein [Croceibacterium sp.]
MKLKRFVASTAAALSLSLAGCATVARPPAGALPGPALWQVADEDTTIYLFGTVHALPEGKQWFDGRIDRAFSSADELVTEIDVSDAAKSAEALQSASLLPEGQSLRGLMTEENRQRYEEALVGLGLPVEALDRYEPWFAALTLSLLPLIRSGYQTQSGVELSLNELAGEKTRGALETVQDQVALFDTLPREAQLAFLDGTVEKLGSATSTLDAMVAEWLEGDAEALAMLLNAEMTDPVLYERLLTARNANWAEWIEKRLEQPGTVFVAVGAGHLAGQGSVQDQLKKRGLKVRRVWQ